MKKNKLTSNIFSPASSSHRKSPKTSQQGEAGYDNARENIDPHLKTKVVSSKEGSVEKVPTVAKDIVNKEYVDAHAADNDAHHVEFVAATHTAIGDAAPHHAESHTVASHNDTSGTGAELDTLTDGSNADALHDHTTAGITDYVHDTYTMTATPSTSGTITLSTDTISYVKIGKLVTITGRVNVGSVSSPAGTPQFSLPFEVGAETEQETHGAGIVRSNVNLGGVAGTNLGIYILGGVSYFVMEEWIDNTEPANLNAGNIIAGDHFTFTFSYISA